MRFSHVLMFCVCALCVACAPVGGSRVEQRLERQEIEIQQMRQQQADTWNELQAMREERDQLKSQLSDLNNAGGARALADRVRQHDAALRQVDDNMALNLPLGSQPPASAQPAGIVLGPDNAPDSSAYARPAAPATQPAQTGSYGLPPDPAQIPAEAPAETKWGQADPQPQVVVPQKDISLALFDAGVNDYNARNYAGAERSFRDFLKNYPKHTQTAEAQYYLGECLFARNQFPQAALEYDAVIKKYPKSSSAPGAYLKQAICFSKMKQPAAAKMQMQAVISKFPNSPEAARAKAFLKTNK